MKRIATFMLALAMTTSIMAQTEGLGIQIGFAQPILRQNSMTATDAKSLSDKSVTNGFKLGLMYDASLWKGLGSVIGFNYTLGAASSKWANGTFSTYPQTRTRDLYQQLELFVDWQYKFEIAKQTYLIVYTGPTIQCALQAKRTTDLRLSEGTVTSTSANRLDYETIESTDLQRLNVTWGVGAGFQYQRYFLRGGYDFGLINPYKIKNFNEVSLVDRNTRGRLDQWSIRLGIYLWGHK